MRWCQTEQLPLLLPCPLLDEFCEQEFCDVVSSLICRTIDIQAQVRIQQQDVLNLVVLGFSVIESVISTM